MKKILIITAVLGAFTFTACKKGCTDEAATNYDEKAKKDDGSCVLPEEKVIPTIMIHEPSMSSYMGDSVPLSIHVEHVEMLHEVIVKIIDKSAADAEVFHVHAHPDAKTYHLDSLYTATAMHHDYKLTVVAEDHDGDSSSKEYDFHIMND